MKKAKTAIKHKIRIKKEQGNICKYCNSNNPLIMTIDHRKPKSNGGENKDENLDCVCAICNYLKGCLSPKDFKEYMKGLIILHKLCKAKIKITGISLDIRPDHYPEFYDEAVKK